jgi:CubicO group peptidase (beta-lactamase class C family)
MRFKSQDLIMTATSDPRHLGLNPLALDTLLMKAEHQRQLAGLNSCQLAVARKGHLGLFATLGEAAAGSPYAVYSVSKPLLASAFWLLMAEHGIDVKRPVVDYIPEFGAHGKNQVSLEQLLTHTAGFPGAVLGPPEWFTRAGRLQCMAQWQLEWQPGSLCQYHPTSSYWVLAEITARISQMDYREFISRRITEPLGIRGFRLGVPPQEQHSINRVRPVGSPAGQAELEAFFGESATPPENAEHKMLLLMNDPDVRALGVPGGGGVASAADVALFYQALLHNPSQLWEPTILADATGTIRAEHPDPYGSFPANRSLGLIIQGDDDHGDRRGMGAQQTSPRCFGHHGAGGQIAWADPDTGISFCFLTDSLDANSVRVARRGPLLSDLAALTAQ